MAIVKKFDFETLLYVFKSPEFIYVHFFNDACVYACACGGGIRLNMIASKRCFRLNAYCNVVVWCRY